MKLLVDLPPEKIVQCVDWRYLRDTSPEEAKEILEEEEVRILSEKTILESRDPKHILQLDGWAYR